MVKLSVYSRQLQKLSSDAAGVLLGLLAGRCALEGCRLAQLLMALVWELDAPDRALVVIFFESG
jgi:hypothetical protein